MPCALRGAACGQVTESSRARSSAIFRIRDETNGEERDLCGTVAVRNDRSFLFENARSPAPRAHTWMPTLRDTVHDLSRDLEARQTGGERRRREVDCHGEGEVGR